MSTLNSRRPSTLAASKALAARVPLGGQSSTAPVLSRTDAAPNPLRGATKVGGSAPATAKPVARAGANNGPVRLAVKSANETREANYLILGAVALLGTFAAVAGGAKFTDSMEQGKAAVAIEGSFARVTEGQSEFRAESQRFATWSELEQRGFRLPARQRVMLSNADQSHWFMRVRDTRTGVECDRIGELVNDPSVVVKPSCRNGSGPMESDGL